MLFEAFFAELVATVEVLRYKLLTVPPSFSDFSALGANIDTRLEPEYLLVADRAIVELRYVCELVLLGL